MRFPALIGCVVLWVSPVYSMEWSASAGTATEYTNNSLQSSNDEQWDYTYIARTNFDLAQHSAAYDLKANYAIEYSTFENKTQSDETAVNGATNAHWYIFPSILTWDLSQQNSRMKQQSGGVDTTDTRTTQSVFSTGPSSALRLTERDTLNLSAQAMDVSTSGNTSNDSAREVLSVGFTHLTSQIQSIGLKATRQSVNYDTSLVPDVVLSQNSVEWNRQYRFGRMQGAAGESSSKRDTNGTKNGGFYQLYFDYGSSGHLLSLAAMESITDSMLGLYSPGFAVSSQVINGASKDNFTAESTALDVIDVIEDKQVDFNYSTSRLCTRCSMSMRANLNVQDYDTQPLDKKSTSLQFALGYALTRRWETKMAVTESHDDYTNNRRKDTTMLYALSLEHKLIPDLIIQGMISEQKRDSSDDAFDNSVATAQIGFLYSFGNKAAR